MKEQYLSKIQKLLSFGHPVQIRDVATLTRSTEADVVCAIEDLREAGLNVCTDGKAAELGGSK